MSEAEVVLTPGEAARHLDVSPSGLRRLAVEYAKVHGELAKDSSGTSRIWTAEAVHRLQSARAFVAAGRARSIKDGLLAVERGAEAGSEAVLALGQDGRVLEALGVVATRLEALQATNTRLETEIVELRREVAELRALPSPVPVGGTSSEVKVVEPQRSEQVKWIQDVTTDEAIGVRKIRLDGALVQLARRIERLLRQK